MHDAPQPTHCPQRTRPTNLYIILLPLPPIAHRYGAFPFLLGLYNLEDDVGQLALDLMTTCEGDNTWCGMLKAGATCTMEAWTVEEKPNLSWSHPWASAPATVGI